MAGALTLRTQCTSTSLPQRDKLLCSARTCLCSKSLSTSHITVLLLLHSPSRPPSWMKDKVALGAAVQQAAKSKTQTILFYLSSGSVFGVSLCLCICWLYVSLRGLLHSDEDINTSIMRIMTRAQASPFIEAKVVLPMLETLE